MTIEMCPVPMSDGMRCGRRLWNDRCLLHAMDEEKPVDAFKAQVQRTIDGCDADQRKRGDLTAVQWYKLPLDELKWTGPVILRRAQFHDRTPFGTAEFIGAVDLAACEFRHGLEGAPTFHDDVTFENGVFDAINLNGARFHGASIFRGISYIVDSYVSGCEFHRLADFRGSRNWETHFSNNKFFGGIDFAEARGPISFESSEVRGLFDVSGGIRIFLKPLEFRDFSGVFKCAGSEFQYGVDLSHAELQGADFTTAWFQSDLNLAGASFAEAVSFHGARFDGEMDLSNAELQAAGFTGARFRSHLNLAGASFAGAVSFHRARLDGEVNLTDVDVRGSGDLDFSHVSLAAPEHLLFVRINQRGSPPLRLHLANTNIDGSRFEDVQWARDHGRVVLADEAAVASDETRAHQTIVAYRRLRTCFEATHLYEEAEDCVWGAMEMRRRSRETGRLARLALNVYQVASCYGSKPERAFGVLLLLVGVLLPSMFAVLGLSPKQQGNTVEPQLATWGRPHEHSVNEATGGHLWLSVGDGMRITAGGYIRGLIHSLQISTFQEETLLYQATSAWGHIVSAAARAIVPAQLALLLLALRRRFSR